MEKKQRNTCDAVVFGYTGNREGELRCRLEKNHTGMHCYTVTRTLENENTCKIVFSNVCILWEINENELKLRKVQYSKPNKERSKP